MLDALAGQRIVAIDLETTGLSPVRDRVVEVAGVAWRDGVEIEQFQMLVNPQRPIPPRVSQVHGITDGMVCDQPRIADILPAFLQFCRADVVVAHNAPFDIGFIDAECARCGLTRPPTPVADTRTLARQRLPHCPNYRLETLKQVLGLGEQVVHRALDDARDCLAVYLHCHRRELPPLRLPVRTAHPIPAHLHLLHDVLTQGGDLYLEYEDTRGNTTSRQVRPLIVMQNGSVLVLEAHCYLRNDLRRFALDRIRRVWRG